MWWNSGHLTEDDVRRPEKKAGVIFVKTTQDRARRAPSTLQLLEHNIPRSRNMRFVRADHKIGLRGNDDDVDLAYHFGKANMINVSAEMRMTV